MKYVVKESWRGELERRVREESWRGELTDFLFIGSKQQKITLSINQFFLIFISNFTSAIKDNRTM